MFLPVNLCFAAKKSKGPPPAISHMLPSGGKIGSAFPCTIGGTLAKTENKVWTDDAGIIFKPTSKPEAFDVSISPEVPPGPHLVRFYNEDGAAPPRVFVVGKYDEVTDTEPNDDFHKAQRIPKIPVTVNGVLEKSGSADTFAFPARAGQWIVLDLQGYALGSQMDPAMKLLDEQGVELAMSHDSCNLDPFIAYEIKKTGNYMAQVMAFAHPPAADVTLKGSASHVYRLTITDQPYARAVWPCAVARKSSPPGSGGISAVRPGRADYLDAASTQPAKGALQLLGWNLGPAVAVPEVRFDAHQAIASDELVRVPTANGESVLAAVVDSPITLESNSNKTQNIILPATICGRIEPVRDEDRYEFSAKKGEKMEFRVRAFALHSPLDAWLHVEDRSGKVLQQSDDGKEGNPDAMLKWNAPADGDYVIAIGDLFHHGGWEYVYAIEAGAPQPRVNVTLAENAFKVDAGKSTEVKCTVKLAGEFKGELRARAGPLPAGVTAKEMEIPAKGGEVSLTLTAAPDAAPAYQPFEILIFASEPDAPSTWKAVFDLRGVEPRGDRLLNEDSRAWITVLGKDGEDKASVSPAEEPSTGKK